VGRVRLALRLGAAAAVLAAGCGRSSNGAAPATTTSTQAHSSGKGKTTPSTGTRHTVTTIRGSTQRPLSGTGSGTGSGSNSSSGTVSPTDPVVTAARSGPGALAPALLRQEPASTILIEVLRQPDITPRSATTGHVVSVVQDASDKDVQLEGPQNLPEGNSDDAPTADDLDRLADGFSAERQGGHQVVVHILFVHGAFQGDTSVLGVSVRADVIAVFEDQLKANSSPVASASTLEEAVTTHEMGHVMGLVDLYLHTGRQDPQHPGHSTNPHSVMYWAVDTDLVTQVLQGGPPVDFDSSDKFDLATIREGHS
jgi:hypothetical protein